MPLVPPSTMLAEKAECTSGALPCHSKVKTVPGFHFSTATCMRKPVAHEFNSFVVAPREHCEPGTSVALVSNVAAPAADEGDEDDEGVPCPPQMVQALQRHHSQSNVRSTWLHHFSQVSSVVSPLLAEVHAVTPGFQSSEAAVSRRRSSASARSDIASVLRVRRALDACPYLASSFKAGWL